MGIDAKDNNIAYIGCIFVAQYSLTRILTCPSTGNKFPSLEYI